MLSTGSQVSSSSSVGLTPNIVDSFILKLNRRQFGMCQKEVALEASQLLRTFVHSYKDQTVDGLIGGIKEIGRLIVNAQPTQFVVGNIVRRVLRIIREEVVDSLAPPPENKDLKSPTSICADSSTSTSAVRSQFLDSGMYNLIALDKEKSKSIEGKELTSLSFYQCKSAIIQAINEFIDELETMETSISIQSLEHIHSNEIIMTYGMSKGVEEFLLYAGRKRKFQVVVAEAGPEHEGQQLAVTLANAGIETTLIPDSAIYALMSRVNKVILGCIAVLANGGIIGKCGSLVIATAAKQHSTPIVVLSGLYKLSPIFPYDVNSLNELKNPQNVLPYNSSLNCPNVQIFSPAFDYVPADYVSTFVTNLGANSPSYIYRLLDECYNTEDFEL